MEKKFGVILMTYLRCEVLLCHSQLFKIKNRSNHATSDHCNIKKIEIIPYFIFFS